MGKEKKGTGYIKKACATYSSTITTRAKAIYRNIRNIPPPLHQTTSFLTLAQEKLVQQGMHLSPPSVAAAYFLASSSRRAERAPFSLSHGRAASRLAFAIPDVEWYDADAIGWAGTNPKIYEGEGHGLLEQVMLVQRIRGSRGGVRWL
eukprot:647109-Hanusia_phi.AAC.5